MIPYIEINNKKIGSGQPAFIIADIGETHNGDIETALRLVDAASEAGADAVKLKSYYSEYIVDQSQTAQNKETLDRLQSIQLSLDDICTLKSHCVERGIIFLSTPYDKRSVDDLDGMGQSVFTIDSGEVTNHSLLRHIAKKGKPVILSTGMTYLGEVDQAVGAMRREGCHRLILLHGVSAYPADPGDLNLRAMAVMSTSLRLAIGLYDPSPNIEVAIGAVALGACIIEKMLTLDKSQEGHQHKAALEQGLFQDMVKKIRVLEAAMGDGIKKPTFAEMANRDELRRSLAMARDVPKGREIGPKDLISLRPATGISPYFEKQICGKKLRRDLKAGAFIGWGDLD